MISAIIIFALGAVGYFVMRALHAPTPGLFGSILAISVFNFYSPVPAYPAPILSFICKVALGIMLGRNVSRGSIGILRRSVAPTIFSAVWIIMLSLVSGYILYWLAPGISLTSALLGSAAGGISEMSIVALALGADVALVLFVQLFRFCTTVIVTPFIAKNFANKFGGVIPPAHGNIKCEKFRPLDYAALAASSIGLGWLALWFRIPAGDLIGGAIGAGSVALVCGRAPAFPHWARTAAQIGIGATIARHISHETFELLGKIFVPLLIPTFVLLAGTFVLVLIMVKFFNFDFVTALLATSPGGLTQMVIMADELGADSLRIAAMQLVRLLAIISIYPQIISAMCFP